MDGVVTWQAGDVAVGAVGRVRVTVDVDPTLPAGSLLYTTAQLDTGAATEYVIHASAATPVGEETALEVAYTAEIESGNPGDSFDLTMEAENGGTVDFTDVAVEFRLPEQVTRFFSSDVIGDGLNCTICDPDDVIVWEVGTLAPGQGRTIIMPTSIADDAQPGSFLLSPTMVTATGSGESVRYLYVLVGDEFVVSNEEGTAETFALGVEAYPSPFIGATTFALSLPDAGDVRLVVYDVLGRTVGTVVQKPMAAGQHEVQWNARNLPSGVYFYRLDTPQGARTGSLVKVR